jgi:hypothetical protein
MEIRVNFDYVRDNLVPDYFCTGTAEYRVFWAECGVISERNLT